MGLDTESWDEMSIRNEVPGLTGMRGLASLYVLVYHIGVLFPSVGFDLAASRVGFYGWSGVDFFFVLSGYLLTFLYSDKGITRRYVVRRIFRTFPLYYLCAILFAIGGFVTLSPLWAAFAQNYFAQSYTNLPFWTLTLEEAFYFMIFPSLLWISKRVNFNYFLLAAILLSLAYRFAVPHDDYALKQIPSYLVDYVAGMWAARAAFRFSPRLKWPTFAVWASVGLLLGGDLNNAFAPVLDAVVYSLVVVTMQDSRLFSNRVSLWLGRVSYSLYLSQLLVLLPLSLLPMPVLVSIPTGIAGSLLLAFALRRGIEEPFLLLGKMATSRVQ